MSCAPKRQRWQTDRDTRCNAASPKYLTWKCRFTIKAYGNLWHHGFKLRGGYDIDMQSSEFLFLLSVSLGFSPCRSSQRATYTTSWMVWTRSGATGCVMWTRRVVQSSRTSLHARAAWKSTSTQSDHFSRARSFWCGTAPNSLSDATVHQWDNWSPRAWVSRSTYLAWHSHRVFLDTQGNRNHSPAKAVGQI